MDTIEKQRVIVYVDGFNFYYGLKNSKWKRYYWIDVVKLFESFMRTGQALVAVKYFSACSTDIDQHKRQDAFFQANKENPKFKLILGKYFKKQIICKHCGKTIHTFEEKETDVRVATQIVADAYQQNCDIAIIVSADSDMVPAVELAREAGQKVFIYFPPNQHSNNLASMSEGEPVRLQRYEARFKRAIMPDSITLKNGFTLSIPNRWRHGSMF
jgi:uncharacterized LabA/DUF88 family protein